MTTQRVTQLQKGHSGTVIRFTDDKIASKLLSMGVLPKSVIRMIKIAPFNGGYYLKVDGNNLAVRVSEAENIVVEL
ncbi:MAG: ferrous iron transport protein A [Bacteroidetes bacterium]|jgi:ferrous iron transport protein A|nr:ferrous iron transport protein A [Bacteroidota bacterium]MDF1868403.1 FeoA family protein [Saprospiraceae bacterium]